jgi:hypothetical protein
MLVSKRDAKEHIYIRIAGPHKRALEKLKERNGEKTDVGMLRILIRDAAKEVGAWSEITDAARESVPATETAAA